MDFEGDRSALIAFCKTDPNHMWVIRDIVQMSRETQWRLLSAEQLEFIIEQFSKSWPPADEPSGGWRGDQNAWDGARFIRTIIDAIGGDPSQGASESLDRLIDSPNTTSYNALIKHVRARQQRLRRDQEYQAPTFSAVKATLTAGLPETIDDLKALILDAMQSVQNYLRQGDTTAWKAFWSGNVPLDENTCRDRFLDLLRGYIPKQIAVNPESRMPDAKRVDIAAIYNGMGLPIEVKGQWHPTVWDAPSVQLIDLYTKDYRASGRGIYLVFWFGPVNKKNLTIHPNGKKSNTTATKPAELREMLVQRIAPPERVRVEVVVIDVSPTS